MNLIIVPGMLVCSSFLISVCMFIVAKALLISSATVLVRAGFQRQQPTHGGTVRSFRPANCCQLISPNRFLNGFPDPLFLFATTRSVFKSVKVSVVEIAKRTN